MKETIVLLDRNDIIINILKKHFPNYKFYHDRTLDKALSHATVKDISLIIIMQDSYDETGGFLCQQFRMHDINVPIVLLTSSQDDYDAVITYELGADDYIVLPINERVLVARLKANIRRAHCCKVKKFETEQKNVLSLGDLEIYPESYKVVVEDRQSDLSEREMKLLLFFYEHKGKVLSRKELLEICDSEDERIIDTYVSKLRRKIEPNRSEPIYIETVKRVGYRFRALS